MDITIESVGKMTRTHKGFKQFTIRVGDTFFKVYETFDGGLQIRKEAKLLSDTILIKPVLTNVIELF